MRRLCLIIIFILHIFIFESSLLLYQVSATGVTVSSYSAATVDSSLYISIPAVDYQGTSYQIILNYYNNDADPFNHYWSLDVDSIGGGLSCGSGCAVIDPSNMQLTIPSLEYGGSFFRVGLGGYNNPSDPFTLYWKLNSLEDAGSGGSSDDNGGNGGDGNPGFSNDSNCTGPSVGASPNDSDNVFQSLAVHPSDPNTLVIGNEGNGVFKSTDGGATWSRINNGIYYTEAAYGYHCWYPEFYEIIFDWSDPTKLYAVTSNGPEAATSSTTSAGFYYSTDGGATWTQSNSGLNNYALMSVAQDPVDPNVLYIGTDNEGTPGSNIYKSTDGGQNWTGLNLPVTNNRVTHIVIDPTNSDIVYCAGTDTSTIDPSSPTHLGLAKSTDGGLSWTQINTGLAVLSAPSVLMDPNNSSTLYATVWSDQGATTYQSTGGGAIWSQYSGYDTVYNLSNITVSPHSASTLIGFTTYKIYTSTDGGLKWSAALDFSSSGVVFKEIVFTSDANTVYGSSDQLKVYRSTDGGVTFSAVGGDIQNVIGH